MGKRIWLPATIASGKMTAQEVPGIWYPSGRSVLAKTPIIPNERKPTTKASQNRRRIRGTSMKKFERSTSFFVAPHVMLYETRCASSACDKWIDKPPKKKKLHLGMRIERDLEH